MKRIMLLLGLLLAVVVPALLVGQNNPNVTESNVVVTLPQKTELELKVIQLEAKVAQLEKQVKILFIDSLYNRENIIQNYREIREATKKWDRYPDSPFFGYPLPKDDRPYRPFGHKEKRAWMEFVNRAEKMVEDPCDIKQKK